MAFHEVRFPTNISLASSGGPERRTQIVGLTSGYERRNATWAQSRRRYDAGYGVKSLDDLHDVIAFFEARQGRLHGFRWKDGADFRSSAPLQAVSALDMALGTGDNANQDFQLIKTYSSGGSVYTRTITKSVAGSVLVAVAGVTLDPEDYSVDTATGVVTLDTAPGVGEAVTAGFEFDVPVRFDTDFLDINFTTFRAGQIPSIPVVEIRLDTA